MKKRAAERVAYRQKVDGLWNLEYHISKPDFTPVVLPEPWPPGSRRRFMKSNIEWQKWGERDPLYSVSGWQGKERGSPNAWTDDEFYELGRSDWADFMRHWKHYGLKAGNCLEIGCGAGRITSQLVQCFEQVTGVDVSQGQLDYARSHISASNVTLVLSDAARLPVPDRGFDAVFSSHVFQHFESQDDAFLVLREVHRAMIDGGTLMIHVPLYDLPGARVSKILAPVVSLAKRLSDLKAAIDRRKIRKGKWTPVMRMLRFDRRHLLRELQDIGFSNIEFKMFAVQSNNDYHEFVFATKRARPSG
jgi:SAM-dependent methyltransferase